MAELLIYYLTAVLIGLLIWAVHRIPSSRHNGTLVFSAYTVIILSFIFYILLPVVLLICVYGFRFAWVPQYGSKVEQAATLVISCLGVAIFLGAYHFFAKQRPTFRFWLPRLGQPSRPWVMLCIVTGLVLKVLIIVRAGGISNSLLGLSHGISQELNLAPRGNFSTYLLYLSMLSDAGSCLLVVDSLRSRKSIIISSVALSICLGLTYIITGKRSDLLTPLFAVALAFSLYIFPLRRVHVPYIVAAVLSFAVVSLFARIFLPAALANVHINLYSVAWAKGSLGSFYFRSLELATFEMIALSVFGGAAVLKSLGGYWHAVYYANLEPLLYVVPRALWPSKPTNFIDISHGIAAVTFGTFVDVTGAGVSATMIGVSWLFGGMVGLLLGMGFLGWCAAQVDSMLCGARTLRPFEIVVFSVLCGIVLQIFRQGTLGWVFLIFFQINLPFVLALLVCALPYRHRTRAGAFPLGMSR